MLISNIINDSFGLLSKQLRFYCWHFRRDLDQSQRRELIELLCEQHFERLENKIKSLNQSSIRDCKQQIGKLLFDHCLTRNRRHQLIQLIESRLVDINVRLDNYGRTLLHRSAYNLDVELVKILIDSGVNIRLRDYAGNTALHIAIQSYRNGSVLYGNEPEVVQNLTSIVQLLLDADRSLQNERFKRKRIKLMLSHNCSSNNSLETSHISADESGQFEDMADINEDTNEFSLNSSSSSYSFTSTKKNSDSLLNGQTSPAFYAKSSKKSEGQNDRVNYPALEQRDGEFLRQTSQPADESTETINPILLEDLTSSLVDTKNAFGRTALHYCVLVVGEQHLARFVKLLISYGADTDAMDTRMKTPLYCLVKRPGISAIRHKCLAISLLLESGCDDLGLAIPNPRTYFTDEFIKSLEENISTILQPKTEPQHEPIFKSTTFNRVPSLRHIARLRLIRLEGEKMKLKRQTKLSLPPMAPAYLNIYINRKLLDQSELF